jgi:hypothetical protein
MMITKSEMKKNMNWQKKLLAITLIFPLILTSNDVAIAQTTRNITTWEVVDESMDQLLKNGWKIVSHAAYRVVGVKPGSLGGTSYDETTYTYILYKNNQHIQCLLSNPSPPPKITNSRCRRIG